jgi:mannose-1-phosphate guanylyltransferase / mannose-6-phosphate isomerase
MKILPVILCGGAGTRVWPVSRDSLPKQFIDLIGPQSTFQTLVTALRQQDLFADPIIITNYDYRFLVSEQLEQIGATGLVVLEPSRRDSGPAVAVAAELAAMRGDNVIVALLAADHVVEKEDIFRGLCAQAAAAARSGCIVTFGINPTAASTAYGYIRPGAGVDGHSSVRRVEAFVEKPDQKTAQTYIAEKYLWNSGNFIFRADVMQSELRRFEPEMAMAAVAAVKAAKKDLGFLVLDADAFARATKKSIDYAVMERTDRAAVIAADIGWSDVGGWSTVHQLTARDADGNSVRGQGIVMAGHNVYIRSPESFTAVVGIDNVIVVTTSDAVLVVSQAEAERVKALVEELKRRKRPETSVHRRVFRPWGYFQSVDNGDRHQVKRIVVRPGGRLSLQKHHHRAEHWIIVKGTAEVTRDGEIHLIHENQSIYLPHGCVHRLGNPGKIDLELIEVQTGSYLGEDDIIRIEDVYNRG